MLCMKNINTVHNHNMTCNRQHTDSPWTTITGTYISICVSASVCVYMCAWVHCSVSKTRSTSIHCYPQMHITAHENTHTHTHAYVIFKFTLKQINFFVQKGQMCLE